MYFTAFCIEGTNVSSVTTNPTNASISSPPTGQYCYDCIEKFKYVYRPGDCITDVENAYTARRCQDHEKFCKVSALRLTYLYYLLTQMYTYLIDMKYPFPYPIQYLLICLFILFIHSFFYTQGNHSAV